MNCSFSTYNITNLVYGERWAVTITLRNKDKTPIDITSSTFFGEFRTGKDRTGTLIFTISTENGTITKTSPANGVLTIVIDSVQALNFTKNNGVWDLWRIVGGERDQLIFGTWESTESATDWSLL